MLIPEPATGPECDQTEAASVAVADLFQAWIRIIVVVAVAAVVYLSQIQKKGHQPAAEIVVAAVAERWNQTLKRSHRPVAELVVAAVGYLNQDQRRGLHLAVEAVAAGPGHQTSCFGVSIASLIQTTDQPAGAVMS